MTLSSAEITDIWLSADPNSLNSSDCCYSFDSLSNDVYLFFIIHINTDSDYVFAHYDIIQRNYLRDENENIRLTYDYEFNTADSDWGHDIWARIYALKVSDPNGVDIDSLLSGLNKFFVVATLGDSNSGLIVPSSEKFVQISESQGGG